MNSWLSRIDFSYVYAFLGEATLSLTLVFYIILARVLGPEEYGIFAAATALGGILSVFIQFGLPALLVREVAINPNKGKQSTVTFLLLEGISSLVVLLFLLPLTKALNFQGTGIIVCYLVVLSGVCRSAKQTLRSVLRGLGEFGKETIAVTIERTLTYSLAAFVLFGSENLVWILATIVVVRAIDIFGLLIYLSKKLGIYFQIRFNHLWQSLQMAYPFAIFGVLWILYYQLDLLMLQSLATSEETGLYGAAYRIIEIFSALPRVIFYVALTRFAQCYAKEPERLSEEIYKSTRLLLVVMLPVLLGAELFQTSIIQMLYGEAFTGAIAPLAILLPSLAVKMFGTLIISLLQATKQENYLPPLLLSTVVVNVLANAILIPNLGALGAAIATLLSEIMLVITGSILVIRMNYQPLGQRICQLAIASLLIEIIPSLMLINLNPVIGIGLIVISTAMVIFLMRPHAS